MDYLRGTTMRQDVPRTLWVIRRAIRWPLWASAVIQMVFRDALVALLGALWLPSMLCIPAGFVFYVLYEVWWLRRVRRRIRNGEEVCAHCGYDTSRCTTGVCSECGCAREVSRFVFEHAAPIFGSWRIKCTFTEEQWFPREQDFTPGR